MNDHIKNIKSLLLAALLASTLPACSKNAEQDKAAGTVASPSLRSMTVSATAVAAGNQYDGTVEAVRQTDLAAQVSGTIIALNAVTGERVKKNQLLVRLDAQAANQAAAASGAQLASARAQQALAQQEFERQKQLYEKNYISKGALDQAEAALKSATAQVHAQAAQTGVASAQTGFHTLKAPYDAVVSAVPATLGDMATPGKALVTLYDPGQLRVAVNVPQSLAAKLDTQANAEISIRVDGQQNITPTAIQLLPAADAATHNRTVWLTLPANLTDIAPGTSTSVRFDSDTSKAGTGIMISIPLSTLVKRAETTSVYVIGSNGQPLLRQLRLGEVHGDQVEVISGLSAGEHIALDPQIAAGTL